MGANIVGDLIGGYFDKEASRKASNSQERMTEAALAEQRRQFDLTREDYRPYREQGVAALEQLAQGMGQPVTAQDVMQDPGYQFGMDQGMKALQQRLAAMGGRVSGNAIKAATRYGTDYATTGYNAAYQRRQDALNRLSSIAGIGQTATGGSAAAGTNAANAISGLLTAQGDATAAGRLQRGRIWGNAARSIAANWGQYGRQQPQDAFDEYTNG
ncbi:MAG: hypothetical protein ACRCUC_03620 [Aestuariivirga sp.]